MPEQPRLRDPRDDEAYPKEAVRIVVRPMGSPLPLGFMVLTVGLLVLSAFDLGWIPESEHVSVGIIVLAFVTPIEFIAAIMAFLARDTAGATGLTIFAGAWTIIGVGLLQGTATSDALGFFLIGFAVYIVALGIVAFAGKPLFAILLMVSTIRFAVMAAYQFTGTTALERIGGWIGLPVAAFGAYAAIALLLEDVKQRTVLPIGRRGPDRQWLEKDLEDRIDTVSREAGVRRPL